MDSSPPPLPHSFSATAGHYAQIPQLSNTAADHQQHASVNDSAWRVSAHTTPITPAQPSMFPVPDRTADLDYPSPSTSSSNPNASPPYLYSQQQQRQQQHHQQQQHVEHYPANNTQFNLTSMTSSSHNENILDQFNQIESRVGPTRVMTRRQRAQMEQKILGRGIPLRHHLQRAQDGSLPRLLDASLYSSEMTRLHPNDEEPTQDRLSVNISSPSSFQVHSPSYQPATPASMPSPSYPYVYGNSRSTSGSTSNLHQVASPALSCASELSSISSASPNSHTFSPYPRIAAHTLPVTESLKPKQKKQRLDNSARRNICLYHDNHPNARQEDIAAIFKVERSTISKILKYKNKWLSTPHNQNDRVAKHRPSKFPDIEAIIERWLASCTIQKITISDSAIRAKAKEIAYDLGYPEEKFKASAGWVENFKTRHRIRGGIWLGRDDETRLLLSGPDTLMSPLNPASSSGSGPHVLDVGTSSANHQEELSSQRSSGREEQERPRTTEHVVSSTSASGQAPWMDHTDVPSAQQPLSQAPLSVHPSMDQPQPVDHLPSHQSATQLEDHPIHSVHYDQSRDDYPPIPTLVDADKALDAVILYVNHGARTDLLLPEERQLLHTIKLAFFQEGSGIPFDRSTYR